MRSLTQRISINPAEYELIKPGLDIVVTGLADAKAGCFPHRNVWHRIDSAASSAYPHQAYDEEIAASIIGLRNKLLHLSQSKKFRLNSVELAAIAFAARLWKAHKPLGSTEAMSTAVAVLLAKIERYRRRALYAATKKLGAEPYQDIATRWLRFTDWMHYNLLYFKVPKRGVPYRKRLWQEQRQQLTSVFKTVLADRFYEAPNDEEMAKLVTLALSSLRRCRYSTSLRELLRDPKLHDDFLVAFAVKRVVMKRLPGAPVPPWQALFDRADLFNAYQKSKAKGVLPPSSAKIHESIAKSNVPEKAAPPAAIVTNKLPKPIAKTNAPETMASPVAIVTNKLPMDQKARTDEGIVRLTEGELKSSIVNWLYKTVTMEFAPAVNTEIQSLINRQLLDQFRGQTIEILYAGAFERFMSESRPAEFSTHRQIMARQYAEWFLRCMLALKQNPDWISRAIGFAMGRAKEMEDEDRLAECINSGSNGWYCAPIRA